MTEQAEGVSGAIERSIYTIRGERVMLDADLAALFGVETKALNRAVMRNLDRFPSDFAFQLTAEEAAILRYQSGTSSPSHGGRRYLPYAFTEQGVAMLSSVLRSPRAVAVNVEIMRAFVRLRRCWRLMPTWPASSKSWSRSTTASSGWRSTRSGC